MSEDNTWMIEFLTNTIIQLSNELEASKQRIAILEQQLKAYVNMKKESNGKD